MKLFSRIVVLINLIGMFINYNNVNLNGIIINGFCGGIAAIMINDFNK